MRKSPGNIPIFFQWIIPVLTESTRSTQTNYLLSKYFSFEIKFNNITTIAVPSNARSGKHLRRVMVPHKVKLHCCIKLK